MARRLLRPRDDAFGSPAEPRRQRVWASLDGVRDEVAEDRRELERVAGAAGGDDDVGALRVARDPEVPVDRVAIHAQPPLDDGRPGEERKRFAEERAQRRLLRRADRPLARVGGDRKAGPVVRDPHNPVAVRGEAVPAGPREVSAEHRKDRPGERPRVYGPKVEHGLTGGAQRPGERRYEERRPRARAHDDLVRAQLLTVREERAA